MLINGPYVPPSHLSHSTGHSTALTVRPELAEGSLLRCRGNRENRGNRLNRTLNNFHIPHSRTRALQHSRTLELSHFRTSLTFQPFNLSTFNLQPLT